MKGKILSLFLMFSIFALFGLLEVKGQIRPTVEGEQKGVCCQTVANVDCIHPDGITFDHSVWLEGHKICDD